MVAVFEVKYLVWSSHKPGQIQIVYRVARERRTRLFLSVAGDGDPETDIQAWGSFGRSGSLDLTLNVNLI